jgi:hypothetical protein
LTFAYGEHRLNLTRDDVTKLFFVRNDLSELTDDDWTTLLAKINSVGLIDIRLDTIHLLLCVMHDARRIDETRFIKEVFLPWYGLKRRTADHRRRIGDELVRLGSFREGSVEDAMHAVNVYRNIVSDLFDPYLTLIFACFQFVEGGFTDIRAADLGNGERTKYDYLSSRVRKVFGDRKTVLSGYDPRVRNAISHTGSSGVAYRNGKVVFKNISRGVPVRVETVEWTYGELWTRTLQLIECIQSIDVCVEIFGLDCTDTFRNNTELLHHVVLHALTAEERAAARAIEDKRFERLRSAPDMSWDEKLKALSADLFSVCGDRGMPVDRVGVIADHRVLAVAVPTQPFDPAKDDDLFEVALPLPRYAVLARMVFGRMVDVFQIEATGTPAGTPRLTVRIHGEAIDAYADEHAGLVDLLNDSAWMLDGKPLGVGIDFSSIAAAEAKSPDEPLPRKKRASD